MKPYRTFWQYFQDNKPIKWGLAVCGVLIIFVLLVYKEEGSDIGLIILLTVLTFILVGSFIDYKKNG